MSKWLVFGLLILLLAALLRYNNLDKIFIFTLDEEYQFFLAKTIVDDFHLIWVGVSASIGFYLGPLWTYFTAMLISTSQLDPTIAAYVSAGIGVIVTGLIFVFATRIFSTRVGLLASFLYASLPLIIYFDQRFWNPTLVPLLSLLMFVSLVRISKNPNWWIVFTACVGFMLHTHLSLISYLPIAAVLLWSHRRTLTLKLILACLIIFTALYSPLLVFDYYHRFSNLTFITRLNQVVQDETTQVNPSHKVQALLSFLARTLYLKPYGQPSDEAEWSCSPFAVYQSPLDPASTHTVPNRLLILASACLLVSFFLTPKNYRHTGTRLLAICLGFMLLGFIFYPGIAPEYYLLGALPLWVIVLALNTRLWPIYVILGLLGIFTIKTAGTDFGMATRKVLVQQVMATIGNAPYALLEDGGCHKWQGWRYVFTAYGRPPERSSVDNSLGWLYATSTVPVQYNIVMYDERSEASQRWGNFWTKITVGGYSANIYKQ